VAGWIRALVSGDRHTDLGSAEAAPVLQLDLPKLADGWRFGKRRGQRPKDGEAHAKQDHGHRDGHEDLEDQHLSSLRAAPRWEPVGSWRPPVLIRPVGSGPPRPARSVDRPAGGHPMEPTTATDLALLVLRVVVGLTLAAHG